MSKLASFLQRNSVAAAQGLPLVQTVSSLKLLEVSQTDVLNTHECDVFDKENINYFFMGRPAYKVESGSEEAEEWELPCCFIFEFSSVGPIKRIFPFDTGAHHLGLYPNYIGMMNKSDFDVSSVPDAPEKIIGAFFGSAEAYFHLAPKDTSAFAAEFSLTVHDAHIKAAHRLAAHKSTKKFDDRRFTIEIQTNNNLDLSLSKPIAVVLPTIYLDDPHIRKKIEIDWNAEPLDYPMLPMSLNAYYGIIYKEVLDFYKKKKLL